MKSTTQLGKRDLTVARSMYTSSYDFNFDYEWSKLCFDYNHNFIKARCPKAYKIQPGSFEQDKNGGDIAVFWDRAMSLLSLMEFKNYKLRMDGSLGNTSVIYAEIWSKKYQDIVGWALDRKKDTYIIIFRWPNGQFRCCDFSKFRDWVSKNWVQWEKLGICRMTEEQWHKNGNYASQAMAIPLWLFDQEMSKHPNFEAGTISILENDSYLEMAREFSRKWREEYEKERAIRDREALQRR